MILLVLVVYAFFAIYEFIPLYKEKLWHDFWINAVLGIISFIIAILLSFEVKIPSPAYPIQDFITSIFGKQCLGD